MKCTAYNGRYLMMGFASDKTKADEPFIVPRRVIAGNFKLCGVLLAYAQPRTSPPWSSRPWASTSCPAELGQQITDSVLELLRTQRVRPVVGKVVPFDDVPAAIEAMANRETVGRTIVTL